MLVVFLLAYYLEPKLTGSFFLGLIKYVHYLFLHQSVTGISYFFLHLFALLLPGWGLARLTGFNRSRMLFVPAMGYVYYVLLASMSKWMYLPLGTFYMVYAGLLVCLLLLSLKFRRSTTTSSVDMYWFWGMLLVVFSYLLYRFLVGPYAEMPGDLYHHMEYARIEYDAILGGHLGREIDMLSLFKQKGGIWYSFFALLSNLSGHEFSVTLPWAMLANSLIFLCVVYSFAWYIFAVYPMAGAARAGAALLATFFVASHLGLNVFSYLRYYSMAPTMLNMVIYFASVVAILELLKWQSMKISYALFIVFALVASMVVHNQETLFILLIGGMMLGWFALCPEGLKGEGVTSFAVSRHFYYLVFLLLFLSGFVAMQIWVYTHESRPVDFFGKVVQLSQQGPVLNRMLYLAPGYQAIQVITLWGLVVYALFVLYWRRFIHHPYLFSGMLLPLVTVFNPLFVDWFLRVEGVHTLWRMLYIVPIHFVAALCVVFLLQGLKHFSLTIAKFVPIMAISALFLLLLPLNGLNPNSRQTLGPTQMDESYAHWQDLIDFLNQNEIAKTRILTDPVTGYVLNGMTKHRTYQHKFFRRLMKEFNLEDYNAAPLKQYKDWLLVINDRNGGFSETGALSRHWDAEVLLTDRFYTQALRARVRENPEQRFELIWEQDKIQVYRLH